MGNLVTNRINFERRDGALGVEAFSTVIARLTHVHYAEIRARLDRMVPAAQGVHVPFDMGFVTPQPMSCARQRKGNVELGLAILSTPGRDLVGAYHDLRDPASAVMPPHMVRTAHSVLMAHGLEALEREARLELARSKFPDDYAAGQAALRAHEISGHFEAGTWRKAAWGVRAHGEEICLWLERGNLCAKFDTMNEGPGPWLRDLAKALPQYHFSGVSYDADNDYSLHFVTDEPGDLSIEESDDPDQVLVARAFVSGMTVEERLEEDRLSDGEVEDDEPEDGFEP